MFETFRADLLHWIIHLFFRLLNSLSIFMSGLYICHPVQHCRLQDVIFSVHHRHEKIHGSPVRLLLKWRKRRNKGRKEKKKNKNKNKNKEEGKEREREKRKQLRSVVSTTCENHSRPGHSVANCQCWYDEGISDFQYHLSLVLIIC